MRANPSNRANIGRSNGDDGTGKKRLRDTKEVTNMTTRNAITTNAKKEPDNFSNKKERKDGEAYIEPGSAADFLFNHRQSRNVRTAIAIICTERQIFKQVLQTQRFNGFIYLCCPEDPLEIVILLEHLVVTHSHIQFTLKEPDCLKALEDGGKHGLLADINEMCDWIDVPAMFSSAVRDYCKKLNLKNAFFRVDIKKSMDTPVKKPKL